MKLHIQDQTYISSYNTTYISGFETTTFLGMQLSTRACNLLPGHATYYPGKLVRNRPQSHAEERGDPENRTIIGHHVVAVSTGFYQISRIRSLPLPSPIHIGHADVTVLNQIERAFTYI
jgi:hypothetical protein